MLLPRLPHVGVSILLYATQYFTHTIALAYSIDLHVLHSQEPQRTDSWFWFSTIGIAVIWGGRSLYVFHRYWHPDKHPTSYNLALEGVHFAWAMLWVLHLVLSTTVDQSRINVVGETYVLLSLYIAQVALSAAILGRWDDVVMPALGLDTFIPTTRLRFGPINSLRR